MIKPLRIPHSQKTKGLVIWCNRCKSNVYDTCKESGAPLKQCENGDKHVFKVISFVPGTENTRRTKSLKTRNYDEAVKEAIRFHKEVKQQTNQELMQTEIELPDKRTIHIATKVSRPTLMIQVIAKFVAHLRGENVPAHLRVDRSEEYLKDVERHFERMVACLTKNDIETDSFFIEQVNDDVVGKLYSFLIQEQKYSNRTFNKAIGYYSSLFRLCMG